MEITYALIIYFIFVILTFIILRHRLLIRVFSSLVLSLVLGMILLFIICPISSIETVMSNTPYPYIYGLIILVTTLVILFYIIEKALADIISNASPLYCWVYNSPSYLNCHQGVQVFVFRFCFLVFSNYYILHRMRCSCFIFDAYFIFRSSYFTTLLVYKFNNSKICGSCGSCGIPEI